MQARKISVKKSPIVEDEQPEVREKPLKKIKAHYYDKFPGASTNKFARVIPENAKVSDLSYICHKNAGEDTVFQISIDDVPVENENLDKPFNNYVKEGKTTIVKFYPKDAVICTFYSINNKEGKRMRINNFEDEDIYEAMEIDRETDSCYLFNSKGELINIEDDKKIENESKFYLVNYPKKLDKLSPPKLHEKISKYLKIERDDFQQLLNVFEKIKNDKNLQNKLKKAKQTEPKYLLISSIFNSFLESLSKEPQETKLQFLLFIYSLQFVKDKEENYFQLFEKLYDLTDDTPEENNANSKLYLSAKNPPLNTKKTEKPESSITDESISHEKEISLLREEIKHIRKENELLQEKIKSAFSKRKESSALNPLDTSFIDGLQRISQIGQGVQSRVYKVSQTRYFALKEIISLSRAEDDENEEKNKIDAFASVKKLLKALSVLDHPNIIKMHGIYYGDDSHAPCILEEFCPYNLSSIVKKLKDINRVTIIYEVSIAMREVHSIKVIHRDLKPENILIDEDYHVKLSDFGISCLSGSTISELKFVAPEVLNESEKITEKVDVYSFGVVLFYILTNGKTPKISIGEISTGKKALIPVSINDFSRELINRCWSLNPEDRPSFSEIVEMIEKNNFKLIDDIDKEIDQIKQFLSI